MKGQVNLSTRTTQCQSLMRKLCFHDKLLLAQSLTWAEEPLAIATRRHHATNRFLLLVPSFSTSFRGPHFFAGKQDLAAATAMFQALIVEQFQTVPIAHHSGMEKWRIEFHSTYGPREHNLQTNQLTCHGHAAQT